MADGDHDGANVFADAADGSTAQRFRLARTTPNPSRYSLAQLTGLSRSQWLNYLVSNQHRFLGTPYVGSSGAAYAWQSGPWWPNGYPAPNGYRAMNCSGFVAAAIYQARGQTMTPFLQAWYDYPYGRWASAPYLATLSDTWGLVYYDFPSASAMLASGVLEKGDIIFMAKGSVDNHVGIFWGNSPSDDVFWHSMSGYSLQDGTRVSGYLSGNSITRIGTAEPYARYWRVIKWAG